MINKPDNVTVVILSEEGAEEISVRHSLRCIFRDCWFLAQALLGHWRRYRTVWARGALYKNHWWMQFRR